MLEIPVASLDAVLQKQVESARGAVLRGELARAVETCRQILHSAPGCLPVRQLLRESQRRQREGEGGGGLLGRILGGLTSSRFVLTGRTQLGRDPHKAVETAEKIIAADPGGAAGHKLLAEAAAALGWRETTVFAWQCASECAPDDPETLVELGSAQLAAGHPADAVRTAERALKLDPRHPRAQALLKDASAHGSIQSGRWNESGDFRGKLKE